MSLLGGSLLAGGGGSDATLIGSGTRASQYPSTTQVSLPAASLAGDLCISVAWSDKNSIVAGLTPSGTWSGGGSFVTGEPASYGFARSVRYKILSAGEISAGHVDFTGGDNGGGSGGGKVDIYVVRGATAAAHKETVSVGAGSTSINFTVAFAPPAAQSVGALILASHGNNGLSSSVAGPNAAWAKRLENTTSVYSAMLDNLDLTALPPTATGFVVSGFAGPNDKDASLLELTR